MREPNNATAGGDSSDEVYHRTRTNDKDNSGFIIETNQDTEARVQQFCPLNQVPVPKIGAISTMTNYQEQVLDTSLFFGIGGTMRP